MGDVRSVAVKCVYTSSASRFSFIPGHAVAGAAGQAMPATGSSLDDKIQQRVQARKRRGSNKYTPDVSLR